MTNPAALLPAVVGLAREAGLQIMQIYAGEVAVWRKGDDSPLTSADLAAHCLLMDGLARLTPQLPRLSEEGADIPFAERRDWTRYWLIDPLDGTREFVQRNGEFTINIALIDEGRPVLGVVHAPVLGITYHAAAGAGAWKQVGDDPPMPLRTVSTRTPPRLLTSRSHGSPELETLRTRLPPHEVLHVGSALKFGLVAEGGADLYPRLGPTAEWDTAAGQCVVEQAGGSVTHLSGSPLRYNTKESLINPHFLVSGEIGYPWQQYISG
jgi:3'(2'), 5'-bisphosphate nucleotidase